ncbi:KPN_02809 family neutral zinc metallopeptidase [Roseibium litorale]|uniref:Zinc metallopeptidase n=1 Tax=Roseibium litorale TaxID=2803841 RepID=A0ABR9CTC5_9HYPH|nr:neutral zinc metallopeptidase [Roseibium litorale]MBD8894136.1 zinc metallopeptidase [Roseibium litorale]
MRWRGRRTSDNIEDRRSARYSRGSGGGGMRVGSGLGLTGVLVVLAISWFTGIDPMTLLQGLDGSSGGGSYQTSEPASRGTPEDPQAQFVSVILADTEDTWSHILGQYGENYPEPTLVLFSGSVPSACGHATSATGPFYCGADQKVYIDLSFYKQLAGQLNAPGDFAQAYVLAHEVGHHLQNLLGVLPEYQKARRSMSEQEANALSVRVELQADCYAGIWAHYAAKKRDFIEDGDIEEALNAASKIGDDTLQKQAQGYAVPETFNHGTSAQRARWFRQGFKTGDLEACNTFDAASL